MGKNNQNNIITLDINDNIASLVKANPKIRDIMKNLGFTDIVNPVMLKTVGKIMTIKKGAKMKGIDLEKIKKVFLDNGFLLEENNE